MDELYSCVPILQPTSTFCPPSCPCVVVTGGNPGSPGDVLPTYLTSPCTMTTQQRIAESQTVLVFLSSILLLLRTTLLVRVPWRLRVYSNSSAAPQVPHVRTPSHETKPSSAVPPHHRLAADFPRSLPPVRGRILRSYSY